MAGHPISLSYRCQCVLHHSQVPANTPMFIFQFCCWILCWYDLRNRLSVGIPRSSFVSLTLVSIWYPKPVFEFSFTSHYLGPYRVEYQSARIRIQGGLEIPRAVACKTEITAQVPEIRMPKFFINFECDDSSQVGM